MHQITIFNLGNADTSRIDLANGKKLLIDYANMRCATDPKDKRINLPVELRADLLNAKRDNYDVVAFTHLDNDHTCGASEFFELLHAAKYQGAGRVKIKELWVPAAVIVEEGCEDETRILRQEARYRLLKGEGIRVFSGPGQLDDWLASKNLTVADRAHLITNAGTLIPGFNLATDGVEFFVHSPFAGRTAGGGLALMDRNSDALTFQATFEEGGRKTRMHFFSDIDWEVIKSIVKVTEYYGRTERLEWDVFKIAHHCSYLSLSSEKGTDVTVPDAHVKKLFETYGQSRGRLISTSKPISSNDEDKQPPHRQAAAYYEAQATRLGGEFLVTMAHKSILYPEPIVIKIDQLGASIGKLAAAAASIASGNTPPPRAGHQGN
ncbi:ComEC/Rec2 family competence protein [Hymenobacter fodinae]|uniref:Metallo-beta-lactamase domain-containing protein n=1 Tax=Hymenobacter fodinae TaxID=2510796 RepID=A0A4Z0P4Y7_9BACT|nr:hypothetical protein [Hymenobacter fodinae]TGE06480.1 hypothetical protein EU556_16720 [Hymenobacter fodinae]